MFRTITVIAVFVSIYAFSYIFSRDPFEFYLSYVIYIIYLPIFFVKYGLPKWPVLLFAPLFVSGFIYVQTGDNTSQQFYKTFGGFFISTVFYHYVIQAFDYDIKLLFKYYMKTAFIIALIGIIQLFSWWAGIRFGYDLRMWGLNKWNITLGGLGVRINSVFSEPAYFAATMGPAFFYSIYSLIKRQYKFISLRACVIIIIAYLITYSSVGIIGIFVTILLLLINFGFFRYVAIYLPVLIVLGRYSYQNVPEFRDRLDGMTELYQTQNVYDYNIHGSSFVLYNNSHVAWENCKRNPVFGTGLGSHPIAFEKYSFTKLIGAVQLDYNSMDANSMFLRLMSETGFYGLIVFLGMLFRSWIFQWTTRDPEYWVISNALALIIILYLIRQGHYFLNGFPFFFWMYYYLSVINKQERKLPVEDVVPASEKEQGELALPST